MALPVVNINPNSQAPEIEIEIGNAHFGKYQVHLYDTEGKNPVLIRDGTNTDDIPDVFPISGSSGGSASALSGRVLYWEIIISSFGGGAGQAYTTNVTIRQDGAEIRSFPKGESLQDNLEHVVGAVVFA